MAERNLYFIIDGEISVYYNKNNEERCLYKLKKGEFFNNYSFVTGEKSSFFLKNLTHTTLLKLTYTDFILILKENRKDYVFIRIKLYTN